MPFAVDSRKVATFALLAQAASWAVGVSAEHLQRGHLYKRTDASVKDDQCTDKPVFRPLVDPDTPKDKLTRKSYTHPSKTMTLVFSDEFEKEGRTFYPGDDQYWTAVDLNYWQTNDLEYYHPSAVTTKNGALEITLSEDARNRFNYTSGMIQSWNKMCFTGGLIEAKLSMPGTPKVPGFWPALWTMGNLGRAGYGATTEGTWPYSYDACDYGALESQTLNGKPEAIHQPGVGVPWASNMSLLPGQKLSRCTCPGAGVEHPGPFEYTSKTYVGRGAPELDILEGKPYADGVDGIIQSAQWGPFNWNYTLPSQDGIVLSDPTAIRSDVGGPYQQTVATLFKANQSCYERTGGCFAKYGMEYKPGFKDAYVTWVQNGHVSWTLPGSVLGPDSKAEISARPIPQEPMYLIANLALSQTWSTFDVANLTFPAKLRIDYIRVYQDPEHIAVTCDPVSFPTKDYIDNHTEAYTNPAHKQWKDAYPGKTFPPNKLLGQC